MADAIKVPKLLWFGQMSVYLGSTSAPPSAAGDGTFEVGDLVINNAPTPSGTWAWVCTTRGVGGTAVFKAIAVGA